MSDEAPSSCDHFLGEYEIPEARRLFARLEQEGVVFEFEPPPPPQLAGGRGAAGRGQRLRIWIQQADQERAERIQADALNIQL